MKRECRAYHVVRECRPPLQQQDFRARHESFRLQSTPSRGHAPHSGEKRKAIMRTTVLFATLTAAFVAADATSKLLPTVRAGLSLGSALLRHVATIKDRLREDVERHMLLRKHEQPWVNHHVQVIKVPLWRPTAFPPLSPWDLGGTYHGSFNYQASASAGLPQLPVPFHLRPRPTFVLVPCRNLKTHVAHILLPCIRIIGDSQQPAGASLGVAPQSSNITTEQQGASNATSNATDLFPRRQATTKLPIFDVTEGEERNSTEVSTAPAGVTETGETTTSTSSGFAGDVTTGDVTFVPSTRAADITEATTTTQGDDTTEATWQSTEESVTATPTGSDDVSTTETSTQMTEFPTEPEDRQGNMIFDDAGRPVTSIGGANTIGLPQPTIAPEVDYDAIPTDSVDFNDILKGAQVSFGKLADQ